MAINHRPCFGPVGPLVVPLPQRPLRVRTRLAPMDLPIIQSIETMNFALSEHRSIKAGYEDGGMADQDDGAEESKESIW